MSRYGELSNEQFVALLNAKLNETSWTVGEIVELERRGIDILGSHRELSDAMLKKRSEFTSQINKALEPYSKQFALLSDSINLFKNLRLENALASNPVIENQQISIPRTAQNLVSMEVATTLEQSLIELRVIRRLNQRDWFQWSIWISSLVAALTALISLFVP